MSRQRVKREGQESKKVAHVSPCDEPVDEILKLTQFSVDKASDEIFWIGSDGRILFVNDAACNALGYAKAELQAMHVWDFDPDYSPELWRTKWQELKEHGSRTFESRHRASDGRVFPVEITANYLNYDGREYEFAFVRNITERKRAEDALRESETKYRIVAENTYDWEFWLSPDLKFIYTSPSCERITGYRAEEFIDNPRLLCDIIHPDDKPAFLEHQRVVRHGDLEFRIFTRAGETRWLHHTCQPVFDPGGRFAGTRGSNRDITGRKAAEGALRKSEARLDSIFRSAPTGIGVVVDRVITEVNQRLCDMAGYAREEMVGRSARFLYPTEEEFLRVGKVKYGMIAERGTGDIETRWRRKDGAIMDVLLSSAPIVPGDLSAGVTFTALDITERKRAEDELSRLASIVTSSDDAIISKTLGGVITSWNRGAEHLYGYSAGEAIGRHVGLLVPAERAHEIEGILEKVMHDERVEHYETERIRKDGRRIAVSVTISPIYDATGRIVGASTIARDITEQKRAERALKKSQYILAKSQEMAHVGNWAWHLGTGEMNWSDEGFRIFGYGPGEIKPTLDWLLSRAHPDDRRLLSDFAAAACEKGLRDSIDYRILRPDGSVRYVNTLLDKVVRDETGRPKWAYGINQDITRRKQAEEKLKKSQYILAKSQEMAHVGNWAWNVRTGELNGSDENYRIFGYSHDAAQPSLEWAMSRVHPDDRALLSGLMESARREGTRGSVDYRIVMPDGSIRYVNTLADKIVRDKSGKVKWVYGINQDITERKHTENALEEAKARAELYIDLMGHDINNMNQVAMGFLELSLDDPGLSESTRGALSKSLESVRASSRLIHNVRKLQQVKTGGTSQAQIDVDGVLRQVRDAYAKVPGTAGKIGYTSETTDCKVMADELLYDVFANIVENAIKHAHCAPVVDIRLERIGGLYCLVAIEDNGPGIPDDMKDAVFGRMRRGDTKAKGSGLGLYLVRTLVESYGGRVWVEDRVPGDYSMGCRFVVQLPVA